MLGIAKKKEKETVETKPEVPPVPTPIDETITVVELDLALGALEQAKLRLMEARKELVIKSEVHNDQTTEQ